MTVSSHGAASTPATLVRVSTISAAPSTARSIRSSSGRGRDIA
jgi:hypothetical protein